MRLPFRLLIPLRRLFEAPVTNTYAGFTLLLIMLAASLLLLPTTLPNLPKYVLMLATMGWLARLCESAAQRWAWLGGVSLLVVGLGLEVSAWVLR